MFNSPLLMSNSFQRLSYSGVISDVNLWEDAGSPLVPVQLIVVVTDTSVITTMNFGNLHPDSLVVMQVRGYILGKGGNGGDGADSDAFGGGANPAEPGTAGGPALELTCRLNLDMALGRIWGGGGGGGGSGIKNAGETGGDGGGGGIAGGLGGSAGSPGGVAGSNGGTGILAIPGGSAQGGTGGSWGEPGQVGTSFGGGFNELGGAGGNSGRAIKLNGNILTYITSDEATLIAEDRLKGAVS